MGCLGLTDPLQSGGCSCWWWPRGIPGPLWMPSTLACVLGWEDLIVVTHDFLFPRVLFSFPKKNNEQKHCPNEFPCLLPDSVICLGSRGHSPWSSVLCLQSVGSTGSYHSNSNSSANPALIRLWACCIHQGAQVKTSEMFPRIG